MGAVEETAWTRAARRIRARRLALGRSQLEVANAAGVDVRAVRRVERANRGASLDTWLCVAEALGLSLARSMMKPRRRAYKPWASVRLHDGTTGENAPGGSEIVEAVRHVRPIATAKPVALSMGGGNSGRLSRALGDELVKGFKVLPC